MITGVTQKRGRNRPSCFARLLRPASSPEYNSFWLYISVLCFGYREFCWHFKLNLLWQSWETVKDVSARGTRWPGPQRPAFCSVSATDLLSDARRDILPI